jgi:acetolactate synthase-1/2/3 large subunit
MIGDGGFLYSTQELATCVKHNIGFPVIVFNDHAYGIISYLQRGDYQEEYESRLVNPDFAALGKAYGVRGIRVESPSELETALKEALASNQMWVIELLADLSDPPFGKF